MTKKISNVPYLPPVVQAHVMSLLAEALYRMSKENPGGMNKDLAAAKIHKILCELGLPKLVEPHARFHGVSINNNGGVDIQLGFIPKKMINPARNHPYANPKPAFDLNGAVAQAIKFIPSRLHHDDLPAPMDQKGVMKFSGSVIIDDRVSVKKTDPDFDRHLEQWYEELRANAKANEMHVVSTKKRI